MPVGIPSIMPQNIGDNRVEVDGIACISEADAERLSRYRVRVGDIVYSRRGDVERRALIRVEQDGWLCGTGCLRVRFGSDTVDPKFASYYLGDTRVRRWIVNHAVGATMPNLNTSIFEGLPFLQPPLQDQRAIAGLLGALDDKIELNRRMNDTLEAAIRLLFRQLMDGETHEVSVADLAQYVNGRNFTKDASGDGRMVIRIAELNGGAGSSTVYTDVEAPDEHVARFGDILFAWSGSLGVYRWYGDDALINQHIFKVVPNGYPRWFVHQHLLSALPFFRDIAADKATTMGHIKRSHLSEAKVEIPSEAALDAASEVIEPLDDRIAANERESRTLAALRDALLPKLISGELRIGPTRSSRRPS